MEILDYIEPGIKSLCIGVGIGYRRYKGTYCLNGIFKKFTGSILRELVIHFLNADTLLPRFTRVIGTWKCAF